MPTNRTRWNDDALAEAKRIIHFQDMLITGISDCLNDLSRGNYDDWRYHLDAIQRIADFLMRCTDDLLELKRGKRGPRPNWYLLGEDVKYFCLQLKRAEAIIRKEIIRNDYDVIIVRLEEAQRQCIEIQKNILDTLPKETLTDETYVSQRAVDEWDNLLEAIKTIPKPTREGRWRSRRY